MARIGIVGTGIAGLGCAYLLRNTHDLTLIEQGDYVGGHTNTITVPEGDGQVSFDTGFMVFNKITYPHLTRLFSDLPVEIQPTSMSFSVQHLPSRLEYCGTSLNHLFAQRLNLFRPSYWRFLLQISRFNQEAVETLNQGSSQDLSVSEYVQQKGYGEDFLHWFLIPMSAAVWSTPPEKMREFPAATLLRFFHNHGFLGLHTHHPWFTVQGGSRNYVQKILQLLPKSCVRLSSPVVNVRQSSSGVTLTLKQGESLQFDQVILASHADQSLSMLQDPSNLERSLLSNFHYQPNAITVHTDESVMPKKRTAWASWNYRVEQGGVHGRASTHYWMNSLQGVSKRQNYFVSLNYADRIDPGKVLRQIQYEHPLFDLPAMRAQQELPQINVQSRNQKIFFCGSYFRYGFHEDALGSAVDLCQVLLQRDPWTDL